MRKKFITTTLSLVLAAVTMLAASPKREFRSTWIAGMNIDFPYYNTSKGTSATAVKNAKSEITNYLDKLHKARFTGVCFHVRALADAYYKSSYEPWASALTGTRGKDPGWDPLAFVLEECHKRGMECYAWVNPFRLSSNATNVKQLTTAWDNKWRNDGWLLQVGNYTVFNPAHKDARRHCLDVMKEIYTNYAIDGMLFDDYFYPGGGTPEDATAGDYEMWQNSKSGMSIADWRRNNVNTFVKELYDEIQAARPDMRFGIGPAGVAGASGDKYGVGKPAIISNDWMYGQIYCDPLAWLHDGTIDFLSPQQYWQTTHATAPFGPLTEWYDKVCTKFNRHLYVSAANYRMGDQPGSSTYIGGNTETGWSELAKQVQITRENTDNGGCGVIWYSTKWINGPYMTGLGDYLTEHTYTNPSLVPAVTWKDAPVYSAPAGLKLSGSTLSWSATSPARPGAIIRYSVYAVPQAKSVQLASGADGLDGAYLQGVTYGTSFTLDPSVVDTNKYWYAVCVYDGYGLESKPAITNYLDNESDAISLVAPADGSAVEDFDVTFSWTAAADATYTIDIATDENFSKVVYTKEGLTGTSHSVNLKPLYVPSEAKCWWRVSALQSKRRPYTTPAVTFTAPARTSSDYEEGYIPVKDQASYAEKDNLSIENLWLRSAHAPYSNFPVESKGSFNRGMTANKTNVYISGRKSNSSSADIYLAEYDAATGAHIRDIRLDDSGKCSYYPCNDVFTDEKGNVIISNLTLNASNNPVRLFKVNLEDGSLKSLGEFSTEGRIDHVGVYGDVDSDRWYVFAAISNGSYLARWAVTNGKVGTCDRREISAYATADASVSHLAVAPHVHAVSPLQVYVDGSSTAFALYRMEGLKMNIVGQLGNSADKDVLHTDCVNNGGCRFTVGGSEMLAYSSASAGNNTKWKLAVHGNADMSDLKYGWTIPAGGLGNTESGTSAAPAVAVPMGDGVTNVYVYSPGNGLAAYAVTDKTSGISDITADTADAPVEYYTLQGIRVPAPTAGAPLAPGLYLRRKGNKSGKILIR